MISEHVLKPHPQNEAAVCHKDIAVATTVAGAGSRVGSPWVFDPSRFKKIIEEVRNIVLKFGALVPGPACTCTCMFVSP